jgi:hypothetical protein
VLQNVIEVGIGVLDGKLRHVEEIGLRVEEKDGAVVVVVGSCSFRQSKEKVDFSFSYMIIERKR